MLCDGGMEQGRLGCEPKVRAGEPGCARGRGSATGEGGGEETEMPGRCWHTEWQEPDTGLFWALFLP